VQASPATLLGDSALLKNPAVQKYVNNVGMWLALQTNAPTCPGVSAVLDDNDVNAFAAPGGYIFGHQGTARADAERSGTGRRAGARDVAYPAQALPGGIKKGRAPG